MEKRKMNPKYQNHNSVQREESGLIVYIGLLLVCCICVVFIATKAEAQSCDTCELELLAKTVEWQGDITAECEFSYGRPSITGLATLSLLENEMLTITAEGSAANFPGNSYTVSAIYPQVVPDSPANFICYRQVADAQDADIKITDQSGEVCTLTPKSNENDVFVEFSPTEFFAWVDAQGRQTDLVVRNLVRTGISTEEPGVIEVERIVVQQADTTELEEQLAYWRAQFRIMADKRDVQKARGDALREGLSALGAKRDIWRSRAESLGY